MAEAALVLEKLPEEIFYPESDGEPMAETDAHRDEFAEIVFTLQHHFRGQDDVYVSGNLLLYYEEGNPGKRRAPDVFVVRGVPDRQRRTYRLWEEGKDLFASVIRDYISRIIVEFPESVSKPNLIDEIVEASPLEIGKYASLYDRSGYPDFILSKYGFRLAHGDSCDILSCPIASILWSSSASCLGIIHDLCAWDCVVVEGYLAFRRFGKLYQHEERARISNLAEAMQGEINGFRVHSFRCSDFRTFSPKKEEDTGKINLGEEFSIPGSQKHAMLYEPSRKRGRSVDG